MPVNRKSPYKTTFLQYYGRPAAKAKEVKAAQASVVITRAFDNGKPVSIPSDDYIEYDIVSRNNEVPAASQSQSDYKADFFVEYDIAGKDSPAALLNYGSGLSVSDEVYIEPFNDTEQPVRNIPRQQLPVERHDKQQAEQPQQHPQQPAAKQPPAASGDDAWQEENETGKKAVVNDKDFLSDIKSILAGQKVYDKTTRKLSAAQSAPESKSPTNESYHGLKDESPGFKESEHAIFDRMAQSMRYANAYDLGSISMEKRFENFDYVNDLPKTKKQAPSSPVVQQSVTEKKVYQQPDLELSSTDFINDLDYINQRNIPLAASVASLAFTNESVIDPATGGSMITADALQPGDIILSMTGQPFSNNNIVPSVAANASHAAVYMGNGNLAKLSGNNAVEVSLARALADDTITVAYRHAQMSPELSRRMLNYLRSMIGRSYSHFALVKINPASILDAYCKKWAEPLREACRNAVVHFKPGTDRNDEFYCSELILQALQEAELSITQSMPVWTPTESVVRLMHNGTFLYIGHLKA